MNLSQILMGLKELFSNRKPPKPNNETQVNINVFVVNNQDKNNKLPD